MSTLGVSARLGRTFQPEDDEHQDQHLAILSDALWQRRFGGAEISRERRSALMSPHTLLWV